MTRDDQFIREALDSLDRSIGLSPPVRVGPQQLSPATCRICRGPAWAMEQPGNDPLLFDVIKIGGTHVLNLHPCCYALTPEDLDDPDYGWIED